MHVKIGQPVSLRIDDDLTLLPEGVAVDHKTMMYFLGILLSEKNLEIVTDEEALMPMWTQHSNG